MIRTVQASPFVIARPGKLSGAPHVWGHRITTRQLQAIARGPFIRLFYRYGDGSVLYLRSLFPQLSGEAIVDALRFERRRRGRGWAG